MGLDQYLHLRREVPSGADLPKGSYGSDQYWSNTRDQPDEENDAYYQMLELLDAKPFAKEWGSVSLETTYDEASDTSEWTGFALVEACYWRKANQIHGWFVNHCQNGKDDCGDYPVHWEQVAELRDLCRRILELGLEEGEELIQDELPPTPGFFFGGYDLDEWYLNDLKDTVKQLDALLAKLQPGMELTYHSSW